MDSMHILFTRFSVFYSPLVATMAGGFLRDEGIEATYGMVPAGQTAAGALRAGEAQVAQSAVSQGFMALSRGETPATRHFAQINEKDGFFIAGREPDPDFTWDKLAGRRVLVDHGGQPLAMFKYACRKVGLDFAAIEAVDGGDPDAMVEAFKAGEADFIHLQGAAPQQLEVDGLAHILACVGEPIGPLAFSSIQATPEWLASDQAKAFMRAYRKARIYLNETAAAEIATAEASFFPELSHEAVARAIAYYQGLGNWTPDPTITPEAYAVAQDVFIKAGLLADLQPIEGAVVAPPAG